MFSGTWRDEYGYFIQSEGNSFDGLYQYTLAARKDLLQTILIDNLSFDTSAKTLSWNGEYGGPIFDYKKLETLKRKIDDERPLSIETDQYNRRYWFAVGEDNEPYICAIITQSATGHNTTGGIGVYPLIDTNGSIIGTSYGNLSPTGSNLWVYKLDLKNMTYAEPVIHTPTGATPRCYWDFKLKTVSFQIDYEYNGHYDWYMSSIYVAYVGTGSSSTKHYTSFTGSLYPDGYVMAPSQLTLMGENELLPGKTAIGKEKVLTGDGSIYGNLDWPTILSDVLNLTPDDRSTTKYYGIIPTKFLSDVTTKQKINYLKEGDFEFGKSHYVAEVDYSRDIALTPTSVHDGVSDWIYNEKRDMYISNQYKKIVNGDTTTYERHLIFQNATTNELLKDITYTTKDGNSYTLYSTENAAYLRGVQTSGSTKYHVDIAYDLDTFTATTIMNKSCTYSWESYYYYDVGSQIVNNRFYFTFCSWQLKSSTAYYYAYVYDDVTKKVITLVNGTTASTPGQSYNLVGELKTFNCGNVIYIMCSWGYFDDRVHLYKLTVTDTTSTLSTVRTSTGDAAIDGYDLTDMVGADIDSTYLFWGGDYLSKSNKDVGGTLYIEVSDMEGNILAPKSTMYQMITVENNIYIVDSTYAYRMVSHTFADGMLHITSDLMYKMITSSRTLAYVNPTNNKISTNSVKLDYTSFKPVNNHTYTINFVSNRLNGVFTVTSYVDSTSLDYDCSVIYGGNDIVVMTPCRTFGKDYSGTITPAEYTAALNTVNDISGEEV